MQIEILGEADFLEEEWWDLWARDPNATPFQSPAWLLTWRRHFADGENVIVTLRHKGRLIGLLPLFKFRERLLLWGAGTSDWLGGVFDPALIPDELEPAMLRLAAPVHFFQLAADSPLARMRVPGGWHESRDFSECCTVLSLPARPNRNMRRNLRYYRRRVAQEAIEGPEQAGAAAMGDLAELHCRRWNRRGEAGVFSDPHFRNWLNEAAVSLETAGLMRLYALRRAGKLVAALFVLHAKGRAFYYIGGFDPDLASLGLGTVLVGHAIAQAEQAGLVEYDFLRGQEDYKYRWGATDRPTYARHLTPSGERRP